MVSRVPPGHGSKDILKLLKGSHFNFFKNHPRLKWMIFWRVLTNYLYWRFSYLKHQFISGNLHFFANIMGDGRSCGTSPKVHLYWWGMAFLKARPLIGFDDKTGAGKVDKSCQFDQSLTSHHCLALTPSHQTGVTNKPATTINAILVG